MHRRSPGTFTSDELTFEAGSTVCLFHCRVWVSNDYIKNPVERYMSGLFTLDEYQPVDRAAYAPEAGWIVFPDHMHHVQIVDEGDPIVVYDEEGLCLFVSMDDLWPQLDPDGYASMLVQERDMEWWAEMEMAGM